MSCGTSRRPERTLVVSNWRTGISA